MDGREVIEQSKSEDEWVSEKVIQENTSSPYIGTVLRSFVVLGLLEGQYSQRIKQNMYRISPFAKKMGLSWKNLKLK